MNIEKIVIRGLIRQYWKKCLNPYDTIKEICNVEGESAVYKTTIQEWFAKFERGDTNIKDKPRSGSHVR